MYNLSQLEYPDLTDSFIRAGWSVGGSLWVLKTTLKGAAISHNAYDMEERCRVLEQIGDVFHAKPKDCPHLDLP